MEIQFRRGTLEHQKRMIQTFRGKRPGNFVLVNLDGMVKTVAFGRMSDLRNNKAASEIVNRKGLETFRLEDVTDASRDRYVDDHGMGYDAAAGFRPAEIKPPFRDMGEKLAGDAANESVWAPRRINEWLPGAGFSCVVCGDKLPEDMERDTSGAVDASMVPQDQFDRVKQLFKNPIFSNSGFYYYKGKVTNQDIDNCDIGIELKDALKTQLLSKLYARGFVLSPYNIVSREAADRLNGLFRNTRVMLGSRDKEKQTQKFSIDIFACEKHYTELGELAELIARYGVLTPEMVRWAGISAPSEALPAVELKAESQRPAKGQLWKILLDDPARFGVTSESDFKSFLDSATREELLAILPQIKVVDQHNPPAHMQVIIAGAYEYDMNPNDFWANTQTGYDFYREVWLVDYLRKSDPTKAQEILGILKEHNPKLYKALAKCLQDNATFDPINIADQMTHPGLYGDESLIIKYATPAEKTALLNDLGLSDERRIYIARLISEKEQREIFPALGLHIKRGLMGEGSLRKTIQNGLTYEEKAKLISENAHQLAGELFESLSKEEKIRLLAVLDQENRASLLNQYMLSGGISDAVTLAIILDSCNEEEIIKIIINIPLTFARISSGRKLKDCIMYESDIVVREEQVEGADYVEDAPDYLLQDKDYDLKTGPVTEYHYYNGAWLQHYLKGASPKKTGEMLDILKKHKPELYNAISADWLFEVIKGASSGRKDEILAILKSNHPQSYKALMDSGRLTE